MRVIVRTVVLLMFGAANAAAQAGGASSGWVPSLELRVQQSRPTGSYTVASSTPSLVRGQPAIITVSTPNSLCSVGIGAGESVQVPSPSTNVWKMSADYLGESAGRHQIRVISSLARTGDRDAPETTTQTLSLQNGDSVVLEALNAPPTGACQVHTVTINARLVMQAGDPALARARYTADMWLVYTNPNGQERREHLVTNIDGLIAMPFMFNRLAFAIPQIDPRQGNAEAVIQLTGALRARPRADGLVDLDVDTNGSPFGMDRPDTLFRSAPWTARKTLTMKVNETIAVDFPPPANGLAVIAIDNTDRPNSKSVQVEVKPVKPLASERADGTVFIRQGHLMLDMASFFKGHKTQLLITLKPLR